jgi:PBSX family phage portal protein
MPLRKLHPTKQVKAARRAGRVSNARLIEVERKGVTAPFDEFIEKAADLNSQQVSDPFTSWYGHNTAGLNLNPVQPVFSFDRLAFMVTQSNILRQCIEAYVVNIESYGHTLEYIGPEGQEDSEDAKSEKARLEAFLSSCSATSSLREMRERARWDQETLGNKAFEIGRNLTDEVVMMEHVPFNTLRRTKQEEDAIEVVVSVPNPADPSEMVTRIVRRRFCRWVQTKNGGTEKVYFKEFGDPRPIDPKTGLVNPGLPFERQATEILAFSLYTPGSFYGLPRWIGQIKSIMGSSESELVNLNFFKDNAIPAMAVLVSGGALTQESFDVIESYLTAVTGVKAMQRIMVLEATADESSGSVDHATAAPKIDMKPMISERQQDGLFQDYDQKNQGKVRSAFRLPPIYTGRAEDYTRASAYASMLTAENQIFIPERQAFDDIMNTRILRTYNPRFWRYKSNGAPITDSDSLSKMMSSFEASGALTPNVAIKIANKVLGVDIKPVVESWGDYPFAIIEGYIQQGREIDGLNEFLVEMETAATAPTAPPAANGNASGSGTGGNAAPARAPVAARKRAPLRKLASPEKRQLHNMIRKEMQIIVSDLRNELQQSLQTDASERVAA